MKFSNPHLIWQMDDLCSYFEPVSCCFTPWLVGLYCIYGALKSHKSRRISVAAQMKCLISPICHSQQSRWRAHAAWALNLHPVPHWCGRGWLDSDVGNLTHSAWWEMICHILPLTHPSPQFFPRCRLPCLHSNSHVYSCKKTVPNESCAPNFPLLSSIIWAAMIDSPVGSLLHNIQLIADLSSNHLMEMVWEISIPLCSFTFASHRPYSGEISGVSACVCCSLLGQLGTSVRKPSSRYVQDPQTHHVCKRATMATCTLLVFQYLLVFWLAFFSFMPLPSKALPN